MDTEPKVFRLNRKSALLTYPNVTQKLDFTDFKDVLQSIAPIKRIVVGREVHALTGEDHFHAYCEWQNKINLVGQSGRSKLLVRGFGVHVSKHRRGLDGRRYCYEYVTKDGDYWESDGWDLFVCSKNFVKEFADVNAWRNYRMVRKLQTPFPFTLPSGGIVDEPSRSEKRCCYWIIGKPSSGKTLWLNTQFENKAIYLRAESNYPYDSYMQERVIAIDDITPKLAELLYMSNVFMFPATVYGATRYTQRYLPLGKRIVIIVLTNKSIEECYLRGDVTAGDKLRIDALYERFNVIYM